jgi:hypothetical protein
VTNTMVCVYLGRTAGSTRFPLGIDDVSDRLLVPRSCMAERKRHERPPSLRFGVSC